jgi:hypothetical protein
MAAEDPFWSTGLKVHRLCQEESRDLQGLFASLALHAEKPAGSKAPQAAISTAP